MKKQLKKAFTLAEIMIVLTIIGVITAILLPNAIRSTPDENVAKFKKANNTLANVIGELVSNPKYYKDGDLGLKPDGTLIAGRQDGNLTYFCRTFAEMLSTKSVNCQTVNGVSNQAIIILNNQKTSHGSGACPLSVTIDENTIQATKQSLDSVCKQFAKAMGEEIVTTDGIVYYQSRNTPFGYEQKENCRALSPPGQYPANFSDEKTGFDVAYKIFCIDVDGIHNDATTDDCVNECPFGYGIRADGKILNGARADAWVQKSIQQKD